jgi:hypothetical protein
LSEGQTAVPRRRGGERFAISEIELGSHGLHTTAQSTNAATKVIHSLVIATDAIVMSSVPKVNWAQIRAQLLLSGHCCGAEHRLRSGAPTGDWLQEI